MKLYVLIMVILPQYSAHPVEFETRLTWSKEACVRTGEAFKEFSPHRFHYKCVEQ